MDDSNGSDGREWGGPGAPISSVRAIVLDLPTLLTSGEVASPMDAFPRFRHRRSAWYRLMEPVLVVVDSADGRGGVGMTAGGAASAAVVNEHLGPLLIGEDAGAIEGLWALCYRATLPYGASGLAAMARSAIDLALWDLAGHRAGTSVAAMLSDAPLGSVTPYASTTDPAAAAAAGFPAIKVPIQAGPWDGASAIDSIGSKLRRARRQIPAGIALRADAWMGWDRDFVRSMAPILAEVGLDWLEEPLPPDNALGLAEARSVLAPTRLAAGEHVSSLEGFERLAGSVDVLQPDLEWCGGLTAALKVCEIASAAGSEVAPHLGGHAWGLQLVAARPVCRWAEWYIPAAPVISPLMGGATPRDGRIAVPDTPGFGVAIDWSIVERYGRSQ